MEEREVSRLIKTRLLEDFRKNERKGVYALTQKVMAYNSNKIEGSTLTSKHTASLFDTGIISADGFEVFKAKDIEEMQGHFKMFNQIIKTLDTPLSVDIIKSYHYQLKSGVFEDLANGYPVGEFKNRANIMADIQTSRPSEVAEDIHNLLLEYNSSIKGIRAIADFHARYEIIHPFQDGNGRTGRAIMFKQCLDAEIIPIIIRDDTKLEYYNALYAAQVENNLTALVNYFKQCQVFYLDLVKDFLPDYTDYKSAADLLRSIEECL